MRNPSVRMLVVAVLALAGCSKSDNLGTAPVSGKISVNNQPLVDGKLEAQVFFYPDQTDPKKQLSGKKGWAKIEPDGTFKVSTYGMYDGAVIGKHRVALSVTNTANLPFDAKYLSADTSGLTFEVKSGTNSAADFNLDPAKGKK